MIGTGYIDHREYDLMQEAAGIKVAVLSPRYTEGQRCEYPGCRKKATRECYPAGAAFKAEELVWGCSEHEKWAADEVRQRWLFNRIVSLHEEIDMGLRWGDEERMLPGRAKTAEPNPKDLIGVTKVPTLSVIPSAGLVHTGLAMVNGSDKYGRFNWREHPVKATIYIDAALRHLMAWADMEENAEDSGVHHLGHVMACCAILLDAQEAGNLIDDRVPGPAAEMLDRYKKGG